MQNKKKPISALAGSLVVGTLPTGCDLCMKGMKLVYFMGGDCAHPPHCKWYCPISVERRHPDAHFADEIPIHEFISIKKTVEKLVYEAKAIDAKGMSLTGGDPLSSPAKRDRVVAIIQAMKIEMGDDFHIHLYTSGKNFDIVTAKKLEVAGLDDLRFHPSEKDFFRIEFAIGRKYTVAGEVPVIPTEENFMYLLKLADHLDMIGADFLNLNEFEICAPNQKELIKRKFHLKENSIAAVDGSRRYAVRFLEEFRPRGGLTIHFCPAAVKDGVQIRERYLRRANNIRKEYEEISEDGCLLFLQIQGSVQEVKNLYETLLKDSKMPKNLIEFNPSKGTLDLPSFLSTDENFLDLLNDYRVKAGIYEILPFREPECAQIREYTPIMDNIESKFSKKG